VPRRIGLLLNEWPVADRIAWERATATDDFFSDDAAAAHWRPKSRQQAYYAYARCLAYVRDYWPETLASRLAPMSVAAELQHVLLALRVLAPRENWTWLGKIQYRWQQRARPRDVRHKMIDPRRLLDLGVRLMDTADSQRSPVTRARQFRDGLLIALLVMVPLRRRSLTALQVDQHLRKAGDRFMIVLDCDDTKAGHPVEFDVPKSLSVYFARYLAQYRPMFPRANGLPALWFSSKGCALGADAIYGLVAQPWRTPSRMDQVCDIKAVPKLEPRQRMLQASFKIFCAVVASCSESTAK